ncbi:MAG: hypothetical protein ACK4NR_02495 [Micavibrio sp.]
MRILKDELLAQFCAKASGKLDRHPELYASNAANTQTAAPAAPPRHKP